MTQHGRFRRTCGAFAIIALAVLTGRSGTAQELTGGFETIDVPGATGTVVRGITAAGRLVGWYADSTGPHGFLFDRGTFTSIDAPFADAIPNRTSTQGINARGDMVGTWLLPGIGARGYLLETHGEFTKIEVPGAFHTRPRAISAFGDIVGWFFASGRARGFIRDRAGDYYSITIPGGSHTNAHSINDRGDIVGTHFVGPIFPVLPIDAFGGTTGTSHGFLMTADGYTTLDVPFPGATNTTAYGINAPGDIVGCYRSAGRTLTYVRDRHGMYRSFEVPGAPVTCAVAINANGDIAGGYLDANNTSHGFVLHQPK